MHADHTAGYPDLILTPWILGHKILSIEVYGPKGLSDMTKHVLSAWKIDIGTGVNGIDRLPRSGCRVVVHEIKPGLIYTDHNILCHRLSCAAWAQTRIWFSFRNA